MFNSLRKLFGRRGGATLETADAPGDYEQEQSAPVPQTNVPRSVRVDAQPAPAPRTGAAPPSSIGVPLKSIIARLAPDLMQRVRLVDVGEAEIFVPTQKVLTQITTGTVRISFGELRQLAPPGTFTAENDRDRTLIDLPLSEILARLNPGLFSRRPAQKHVDVPEEVVGPFGGHTKLQIVNPNAKPAPPAPAAARTRPATGPGVPPPLRTPPPQPVPLPAAPRIQPQAAPIAPAAAPIPRAQPPIAPGQPIFARIRPSAPTLPIQPPAPPLQPPVQPPIPAPAAPAPAELEEEPVFHANNRLAPTPPPAQEPEEFPPLFTPIAPEARTAPRSGDTEVIRLPENYNQAPPPAPEPITPIAPVSEPEPEPIRFSAPPAAEPAMPVTSGETRFITVSIAELSEGWPEVVRNEINASKLSGSWIGLPLTAVEGIIKSGKIAFPWKAMRSWIKPPVAAAASPYDTTMLELPLKTITPLFLAELKATRAQKRYSLGEAIPDLFFNSQPPEAVVAHPVAPAVHAAPVAPSLPPLPPVSAPPPSPTPALRAQQTIPIFPAAADTARPADTNYFVRNEKGAPVEEIEEESPVFLKKGTNAPGTAFLNRYATPNEIVSKAASLEGVDGALIALPDGLLVASRIPTNMNADTIAAFLPQIFGRVSQCTRELRLGELNNLNFTVGSVPWKIFRVGSIYFAAFGRPGVPLPTSQLVGLAAELDRKAK
jgi:predicted regulator of Ras-like GTPase activity (Roadblock/LC7/MglB family)